MMGYVSFFLVKTRRHLRKNKTAFLQNEGDYCKNKAAFT